MKGSNLILKAYHQTFMYQIAFQTMRPCLAQNHYRQQTFSFLSWKKQYKEKIEIFGFQFQSKEGVHCNPSK
jgi:hypothetical protein